MARTDQSPASPSQKGSTTDRLTWWVGWVLFAGITMLIAGLFNIIEGLVALFNSDYYVVRSSGLVFQIDYTRWGWTLIILGGLLALAGYGVVMGQTWGRIAGVIVAIVNAVVNLGFIAAYPVWIVLTIALDGIVVYALIVHGREAKALRS